MDGERFVRTCVLGPEMKIHETEDFVTQLGDITSACESAHFICTMAMEDLISYLSEDNISG